MTAVFMLIPVLLLLFSMFFCTLAVKRGRSPKKAFVVQLISFAVILALTVVVPMTASATSTDTADTAAPVAEEAASQSPNASSMGLGMLAAALVTGMSGIGGGIAVAAAAPAAIGATSEDPKNFGKSMIFVALGEGIAIYGLLISILIWSKY